MPSSRIAGHVTKAPIKMQSLSLLIGLIVTGSTKAGFSIFNCSRSVLSNMIATSHLWLPKFKLIIIKNLVPQSYQLYFKGSIATHD